MELYRDCIYILGYRAIGGQNVCLKSECNESDEFYEKKCHM